MASEIGRFAILTEEDLQDIIDNKDSKQTKAVIEKSVSVTIVSYILNLFISKIFMRYSKTYTTWFKGGRMGRSDMVSLWCVSLLITLEFAFLF